MDILTSLISSSISRRFLINENYVPKYGTEATVGIYYKHDLLHPFKNSDPIIPNYLNRSKKLDFSVLQLKFSYGIPSKASLSTNKEYRHFNLYQWNGWLILIVTARYILVMNKFRSLSAYFFNVDYPQISYVHFHYKFVELISFVTFAFSTGCHTITRYYHVRTNAYWCHLDANRPIRLSQSVMSTLKGELKSWPVAKP